MKKFIRNVCIPSLFILSFFISSAQPLVVVKSAINIGASGFTASWEVYSSSLENYRLDVSTRSDFATKVVGYDNKIISASATSSVVSSLIAGTQYYYRVQACLSSYANVYSGQSATIPVTTLPPPAPTVSVSNITLTSFKISLGGGGSNYNYYVDVAHDNGFINKVGSYNNLQLPAQFVSEISISGLSAGTRYYYRVRQRRTSGGGYSNYTQGNAITLPAKPLNLRTLSVTSTTIALAWNASIGAQSYVLKRYDDDNPPNFTLLGEYTTTATEFTINGLPPGQLNLYRVLAVNASGTSEASSYHGETTTLSAPVLGTPYDITTASFKINWNAVAGASSYLVDVATNSSFANLVVNAAPTTGTSYNSTGLIAGTTYYVRVRAKTSGVQSDYSVPKSLNTLIPSAPTVSVSNITLTSFSMSLGGAGDEYNYYVDVATDDGFTNMVTNYNDIPAQHVSEVGVSGLSAGTRYYYRVRKQHISGGAYSNYNQGNTITIPAKPTNLRTISVTNTTIVLAWNASVGAQSYILERYSVSGVPSLEETYTTSATSLTLGTLSPGTLYLFKVSAVNASGTSPGTSIDHDETTTISAPVLGTPCEITTASFKINWNTVAGASSYLVDVATNSSFANLVVNAAPTTGTSYNSTGLIAGTTYYVRVKAKTSGVQSDYSVPKSLNTLIPSAPTVSVSNITLTSFSMSLGGAGDEYNYYVDVATDDGFTSMVTNYSDIPAEHVSQVGVSGLSAGTRYYYRVRKQHISGGAYSNYNQGNVITIPAKPTNLRTISVTNTTIVLAWNGSVGAESYVLKRYDDDNPPNFNLLEEYTSIDPVFTIDNLPAGQLNLYRVLAVNAGGTSEASTYHGETTTISAPVLGTPYDITTASFKIDWSAVAGVSHYQVDVATNTSFTNDLTTTSTASTTHTALYLSDGTTYYVRIRAVSNDNTHSEYLGTQEVTTQYLTTDWITYPNAGEVFLGQGILKPVINTSIYDPNYMVVNLFKGNELAYSVSGYYDYVSLRNMPTGNDYRVRVYDIANEDQMVYSDYFSIINVPSSAYELNYIKSTQYDNRGPYSSAVQFFDKRGKLVQSQSKNVTENQWLASQPLYDAYDRAAGQTLPAPIPIVDEVFPVAVSEFVTTSLGQVYEPENFNKTIPDPVGKGEGTLGHYYSTSNEDEPYVATDSRPFSKIEYYDDGSGEVKSQAAPGDQFVGTGKKSYSKTFPVFNDLDNHYAWVYDKLLGKTGTSFQFAAVKSVSRGVDGKEVIGYSDEGGNGLVSAYGYVDGGIPLNVSHLHEQLNSQFDLHVPQVAGALKISGLPSLKAFNLLDNSTVISGGGNHTGTLNPGFYRCRDCYDMEFTFSYYDASFNFYDDLGRLIVSVPPLGVKDILSKTQAQITEQYAKENIPYATYYTYDYQGRLLTMKETDAGITNYVYRKDGSIRFSQNAKQKANGGRFSYTNYDKLGRPVESGEYVGTRSFTASFSDILETTTDQHAGGGLINSHNERKDWVRTSYDLADEAPGATLSLNNQNVSLKNYYTSQEVIKAENSVTLLPGFFVPTGQNFTASIGTPASVPWPNITLPMQDFVHGAVSYTENENSKTWYSYDEMGRVTWMASWYPKIFEEPKLVEYQYDFLGNVTYVKYQDGEEDAFYHRYIYDKDKRLSKVYAAAEPIYRHQLNDIWLQAEYEYYTHGPLKKVTLADGIEDIEYYYTLNGQLKSINNPATNDHTFSQTYHYFDGDYTNTNAQLPEIANASQQFNGNIGAVLSKLNNSGTYNTMEENYTYDNLNQLKSSLHSDSKYDVSIEGYDSNGNIKGLVRKDNEANILHNLTYRYEYGSNKLTSVNTDFDEFGGSSYSGKHYEYNEIGEMDRMIQGKVLYYFSKEFQHDSPNPLIAININQNDNPIQSIRVWSNGSMVYNGLLRDYNSESKYASPVKVEASSYDAEYELSGTVEYYELNELSPYESFEFEQRKPTRKEEIIVNSDQYMTYDVTGKVKSISNGSAFMDYEYDDRGFRIRKVNGGTPAPDDEVFVRDASGSIMAVYRQDASGVLKPLEHPIYGASRLGTYTRSSGFREYELKDHLG